MKICYWTLLCPACWVGYLFTERQSHPHIQYFQQLSSDSLWWTTVKQFCSKKNKFVNFRRIWSVFIAFCDILDSNDSKSKQMYQSTKEKLFALIAIKIYYLVFILCKKVTVVVVVILNMALVKSATQVNSTTGIYSAAKIPHFSSKL